MLIGHIYDEQWAIQITITRKKQQQQQQQQKHLQTFTFFPFLPIIKTRKVNIQAQKFNKHSYTVGSPEHDFIC